MWPFKSKFERGLISQAKQMQVAKQVTVDNEDGTMASISIDHQGFYHADQIRLGELAALIMAQAQLDGVSRVQLYYGNNRMVYTINGIDHKMIPCPSPMNVDIVRAIVNYSATTWDTPGAFQVSFSDHVLSLKVLHKLHDDNPSIEITGFTGKPRIPMQNVSVA